MSRDVQKASLRDSELVVRQETAGAVFHFRPLVVEESVGHAPDAAVQDHASMNADVAQAPGK